jgi:Domain of unknown function (DUF5666)
MFEVQPKRVDGPPVLRVAALVVLVLFIVAGGAVVLANSPLSNGAAPVSNGTGADPATTSASPDPSAEPSKGPSTNVGPDRGFGRGPLGAVRGLFGGLLAPAGAHQITIQSISGNNVTLATDDGWSRTIDASTATITRAGATIAVGDLNVGDSVLIQETRNDDGTYTVTNIQVVLPRLLGTITDITGNDITLKQHDGTTVTVHVSDSTTYHMPGVDNPTLSDLKVDQQVIALGTLRDDGSLDAVDVSQANLVRPFSIGPLRPFGPFGRFGGPGGPSWGNNGGPGASPAPSPDASGANSTNG